VSSGLSRLCLGDNQSELVPHAHWKTSRPGESLRTDVACCICPAFQARNRAGAIPKVWGLNVCRQRPELGCEMPKAARAAGNKRFNPPMWRLDDPKNYRLPEYSAWSPTMAKFSGWPFYSNSRPFHHPARLIPPVGARSTV
jgi:hypothetical protein